VTQWATLRPFLFETRRPQARAIKLAAQTERSFLGDVRYYEEEVG
jgi:hypothetical protein